MVSGWKDAAEPWLKDLISLVHSGIPVAVLHHYDPHDIQAGDGHFRVVVGFNETHIITHDPWDRDGQPRIFAMTFADFVRAWNYTEPFSPRKNPYFGTAAWPLQISVEQEDASFVGKLFYADWLPNAPTLSSVSLQMGLYRMSNTSKWEEPGMLLKSSVNTFQSLAPGQRVSFSFDVIKTTAYSPGTVFSANYRAWGLASGSMPSSVINATASYPSYEFIDVVGSEGNMTGVFIN